MTEPTAIFVDRPFATRKIRTVVGVIDALGGNQPVAKMAKCTHKAVSNWRRPRRKLPAATYLVLKDELAELGLSAPDSLWAMRPKRKRSNAGK